jgi:hypothetical protein
MSQRIQDARGQISGAMEKIYSVIVDPGDDGPVDLEALHDVAQKLLEARSELGGEGEDTTF